MPNKTVYKSAIYSYINIFLTAIIGIVSQPMMLNYFGKDTFGVWSLTLGIVAYIGNSSIGIPTSATVLISKTKDDLEKKKIIINSYKLLFISSILFLVILFLLNFIFKDWIFILGKFPNNLVDLAKQTVIISATLFLIKSPLQISQAGFQGYQNIDIAKIYEIFNTMVPFISLLIIIVFKLNLISLAYLIGVGYIIINLIATVHFIIIRRYNFKFILELFKISNFDKVLSESIVASGVSFFVIGIAAMLIYNTDNLVISNILGVSSIPVYSLTYKLFTLLIQTFNVFVGIFFPMYGKAYMEKNYVWIQKVYDVTTSIFSTVAGAMWIGGLFFTQEVINIWTGRNDLIVGFLLPFSLGGFVYSLSTVNLHSSILSGINKNRKVIKVICIEGFTNLVLSIIFAKIFGVGGVALGTFIASFFITNIYLSTCVNKETCGNIKYKNEPIFKHLIMVLIPNLLVTIGVLYFYRKVWIKLILLLIIYIEYFTFSYIISPEKTKKFIKNKLNVLIIHKVVKK